LEDGMSDIVERLRQVAAAYKSLPTSGIWATMTVDRDASCNNLTDAADEIERLRAEVAGLREDHDALLQFAKHVRRYGDTGIASMAIAVLAARKGEA
jgi:hypothetical protein